MGKESFLVALPARDRSARGIELTEKRRAALAAKMTESLRDAVRESGYSQNEVARQIGCTSSAMSQFMNGLGMRAELIAPLLAFLALEIRQED